MSNSQLLTSSYSRSFGIKEAAIGYFLSKQSSKSAFSRNSASGSCLPVALTRKGLRSSSSCLWRKISADGCYSLSRESREAVWPESYSAATLDSLIVQAQAAEQLLKAKFGNLAFAPTALAGWSAGQSKYESTNRS